MDLGLKVGQVMNRPALKINPPIGVGGKQEKKHTCEQGELLLSLISTAKPDGTSHRVDMQVAG